MHMRIAKFEGDPDRLEEAIDAARQQADANWDSPPRAIAQPVRRLHGSPLRTVER